MRFFADTSQLTVLAATLRAAGVAATGGVDRIAARNAAKVRDAARETMAGSRTLPHYSSAITYERDYSDGSVAYAIGPETGGQGSLGHLLEYGTSTSGPIKPHMNPAADAVQDDFADELGDLLDGAW